MARMKALLALAAPALLGAPGLLLAQTGFPVKPIRYIVPVSAGGGSDMVVKVRGEERAEFLEALPRREAVALQDDAGLALAGCQGRGGLGDVTGSIGGSATQPRSASDCPTTHDKIINCCPVATVVVDVMLSSCT